MRKLVIRTVPIALFAFYQSAWGDHPAPSTSIGGAGPLTTIAAIPTPPGECFAAYSIEILEFDEFSDARLAGFAARGNEEVHATDRVTVQAVSIDCGINNNFSVGFSLPYVDRKNIREGELEDSDPEAHLLGDSTGLGDGVLLFKYRFAQNEQKQSHTSLIFGAKLSTGNTDEKEKDGKRFETEFQPGSGSTDPMLGFAYHNTLKQFNFDTSLLYQFATEGTQDTDLGDAMFFNTAFSFQVTRRDEKGHDHAAHGHWDFVFEVNAEAREKQHERRKKYDDNSGGLLVYVSPGFRYTIGKWSAFGQLALPAIDNRNGKQSDVDYRLTLGFGKAF